MQDLIFYVAANETLGAVRDYANMRNESAPTLVLGVSVCLRMRLFTERNVATPYPISAFSGIAAWNWSMDGDYDHSTTCKLTADAGSITVHSVSDSINGETMTFTEFVIPISTMNTEELATWLGTAESKRGLTGELVGYDTDGNAVFVLQIENFTVRNRVTGIGEPTSQNQELVTRTEAQSMILYAISGATIDVSNVTSAASAGSATSAGYAASAGTMASATSSSYGAVKIATAVSSVTSGSAVVVPTVNAMIDYVSSHGGSGGGVYSGGTASYASSAGGLTSAAMSAVVSSAAGAVNITSVAEAGVASSLTNAAKADILSSAGGSGGTVVVSASEGTLLTITSGGDLTSSTASFSLTATSLVSSNSGYGIVARVDTIDERWGGPSSLNAFAVPTVNAVSAFVSSKIASAAGSGGSVSVSATYAGPFAVTASGSTIAVAGGRMYLGGAEYAVTSTTLTSSNGTVYYYVYYSSGSYYSGCSVAGSASALAAVLRGSQGYYTALANVQGGSVTQCHYGDIRIDGRVS